MLDTLVLHLPMKKEFVVKTGNLSSIVGDISDYQVPSRPLSFSKDLLGNVSWGDLRHDYESIPSSYGGMGMKFNAVNVANTDPYVSLNASVKFLQGHNVYGTSTVENLGKEMIGHFAAAYPHLFACIDHKAISISRIDSTYSAVLPSECLAQPALKYLAKVSNGHRKSDTRRDFYNTVYFGGAKSRNGGAKIYGKGHEVNEFLTKLKAKSATDPRSAFQLSVYTPELIAYSQNLLRLESITKRRVLEQLLGDNADNFWQFIDYEKNNPDVLHMLWSYWFQPILDALKGTIVRKVDDHDVLELLKESLFSYQGVKLTKKRKFIYRRPPRPAHLHLPLKEHDKYYGKKDYQVRAVPKKVYTKAYNAYNFYQLLRLNGYDNVKERTGRRAFDIKVKTLVDAGISKSDLQNLASVEDEKHDISSLIKIDYDKQVPCDFVTPTSQFIDVDLESIHSMLPNNETPADSSVKSIEDLNNELAQLRDSYNDDLVDNHYGHFYESDYDYSGFDNPDGSPTLNSGQLRKIISK